MALVTEADVALVAGIEAQAQEIMGSAAVLVSLMTGVSRRIDLDSPLNADTDFAEIVAIYTPLYDANLSALKALVEALPRWEIA